MPLFSHAPNRARSADTQFVHRDSFQSSVIGALHYSLFYSLACIAPLSSIRAEEKAHPKPLEIANASAKTQEEMKPYTESIEHSSKKIEMVPIPGGEFAMGSPAGEKGRSSDEGPQHRVSIDPFWMGKYEITWGAYDIWAADLDIYRRDALGIDANVRDKLAEPFQVSKPTEPYTDMSFGMGKRRYPAICMTQHAARTYCQWLTAKTGRYYRLPTEAEWEYACRAGSKTAYSFGDDASKLNDYAWHLGNSEGKYQLVGQKKPNAWGLYDMHGNVSEWVLDQHSEKFYGDNRASEPNPLAIPKTLYPRVVRGGGWDNKPLNLRSSARIGSSEDWKEQDPQIPQSIWYHTDARSVGLRIVRPLRAPTAKERKEKWDNSQPVQVDLD